MKLAPTHFVRPGPGNGGLQIAVFGVFAKTESDQLPFHQPRSKTCHLTNAIWHLCAQLKILKRSRLCAAQQDSYYGTMAAQNQSSSLILWQRSPIFDLVNIWKRQRRHVPRVPADLEVWTWFQARVLDNPELRERFKKEGLDSFLVFCQLQWADYF